VQITAYGDLVGQFTAYGDLVGQTALLCLKMQVANEGKRIIIKVGLADSAHKEAHSHTAATNYHHHSLCLLRLLEKMNVSICLA
jgi:hypothetical protein